MGGAKGMDLLEVEDRLHFPDAPEHPGVAAVVAYWETKRAGRTLPDRFDIDPSEIVPLLPNIIICESVDQGADFRIRIFGTKLVELVGEERTGKLLSEIGEHAVPPTRSDIVRDRWLEVSRRAFAQERPVFVSGRMSSSNRAYIAWHAVSCPLTAGGTDIAQTLGGMFVAKT